MADVLGNSKKIMTISSRLQITSQLMSFVEDFRDCGDEYSDVARILEDVSSDIIIEGCGIQKEGGK